MSNAAATERRAAGSTTKLMVSVQVDVAWGRLPGGNGSFVGVARDRADFPFVDVLGLSSYPYLAGFKAPEEIPLDYYSRLTADAPLPMIVTEGGWTSGSVAGVTSSPELQARYIRRQMQLADAAKLVGVFQITFTDLDVATYNLPPGSILPLFAQLGLRGRELSAEAGARGVGFGEGAMIGVRGGELQAAEWRVPSRASGASRGICTWLFARWFHAETRTTAGAHGEPLPGRARAHRRTVPLHPQLQILCGSDGERSLRHGCRDPLPECECLASVPPLRALRVKSPCARSVRTTVALAPTRLLLRTTPYSTSFSEIVISVTAIDAARFGERARRRGSLRYASICACVGMRRICTSSAGAGRPPAPAA